MLHLRRHRALLIQDIRELKALVERPLQTAVTHYERDRVKPEEALAWIIQYHIQECHLLYDPAHEFDPCLQAIANHVDHALGGRLESYLSFYIKVPRLYGDNNQIKVELRGRDLNVYYG